MRKRITNWQALYYFVKKDPRKYKHCSKLLENTVEYIMTWVITITLILTILVIYAANLL